MFTAVSERAMEKEMRKTERNWEIITCCLCVLLQFIRFRITFFVPSEHPDLQASSLQQSYCLRNFVLKSVLDGRHSQELQHKRTSLYFQHP